MRTKKQIIESLNIATVIQTAHHAGDVSIWLSFKDAPYIEYELRFPMFDFETSIEEQNLHIYDIDEREVVEDIAELAGDMKPSMIIHCLKFGMPFESYPTENDAFKKCFEKLERLSKYLDTKVVAIKEFGMHDTGDKELDKKRNREPLSQIALLNEIREYVFAKPETEFGRIINQSLMR